jgi:hypothetical protein
MRRRINEREEEQTKWDDEEICREERKSEVRNAKDIRRMGDGMVCVERDGRGCDQTPRKQRRNK